MKKWGEHLALDCAGGNENIKSREAIAAFCKDLVESIDMKAYGDPVIVHFAEHDASKAGYSLVQLIETSNICAHFVDLTGDFYLDIFSCKNIPVEISIEVVKKHFNPASINFHFLNRGV